MCSFSGVAFGTSQKWVSDADAKSCWVKTEQEELLSNSLEYSMSLLFSFSPLANSQKQYSV